MPKSSRCAGDSSWQVVVDTSGDLEVGAPSESEKPLEVAGRSIVVLQSPGPA